MPSVFEPAARVFAAQDFYMIFFEYLFVLVLVVVCVRHLSTSGPAV
jgi:hypothetical protein